MKSKEGYGQDPRIPFWPHKDINGKGCWIWRGGKNKNGQGVVRHEGRNWVTSRLAWTLVYGPIPNGLWILHRCDDASCINPNHLFLGTARDNSLDMWKKGRHTRRPRKQWADCHPNKKHVARGFCCACYQQWWRNQPL